MNIGPTANYIVEKMKAYTLDGTNCSAKLEFSFVTIDGSRVSSHYWCIDYDPTKICRVKRVSGRTICIRELYEDEELRDGSI